MSSCWPFGMVIRISLTPGWVPTKPMCWTSKRQHGGMEGPGRITFRVRFFHPTSFNEFNGKNNYSLKRTYTEISFLKQKNWHIQHLVGSHISNFHCSNLQYSGRMYPMVANMATWESVSWGSDHGMVLESTIHQTLKDHRMVMINIWTAKKAANKQRLVKSIQILSKFQSLKAINK